jgi:hypothetical protein
MSDNLPNYSILKKENGTRAGACSCVHIELV